MSTATHQHLASAALELPRHGSRAIPLLDLVVALDDYAAGLYRPITGESYFSRPAGVPDRLEVPIDIIAAGRYQPRKHFDEAKLDELTESIKEHGILNPLVVFANEQGKLELIGGERRWRAAQRAGLSLVPVEIRSYTLRQIDEISTIDNLQRDDLSALDEGTAYERMIKDWGISEAELSRRLSKPRSYIQQRRSLATAAPEVQAAVAEGVISFTQARIITAAAPHDAKAQIAVLKEIRSKLAGGFRVTEADARELGDRIVARRVKEQLQALGWKIEASEKQVVVWAANERPCAWTGAEILAAVKAGRRPAGEVPAAHTLTPEEHTLLYNIFGYGSYSTTYTPWVWLYSGQHSDAYPSIAGFYAPAELPARCAQLQQHWTAMQGRYAAHGWELTHHDSHYFNVRSSAGRQERLWLFSRVEEFITEIEAGKVDAAPPVVPTGKVTTSVFTVRCERCGTQTSDYRWIEHRTVCRDCAPAEMEANATAKAQTAQQVAAVLGTWLFQAPIEALRLVVASHPSYAGGSRAEQTQAIASATHGDLAQQILQHVAKVAYQDRAHPVVAFDEEAARAVGATDDQEAA